MKAFKDERPVYGQDPHIAQYNDGYLLIESVDESRIAITPLQSLQITRSQPQTVVWDEHDEHQVWAPELHYLQGRWWIYYSFSSGENHGHRNHVLRSETENPMGPYKRFRVTEDVWGIDLTTFEIDGVRYAAWSGWENNGDDFPQHLYIARHYAPLSFGPRFKISTPEFDWETSHQPINEGPQYHNGFLYFSANGSWTQDYCTGVIKLIGENPLDSKHWYKNPTPLLMNAGHGHVVDDTFVYHRKMSPLPGWMDREICTKPVSDLF